MKYVLGKVETNNTLASKKCILNTQESGRVSRYSSGLLTFSQFFSNSADAPDPVVFCESVSTAVHKSSGNPTRG